MASYLRTLRSNLYSSSSWDKHKDGDEQVPPKRWQLPALNRNLHWSGLDVLLLLAVVHSVVYQINASFCRKLLFTFSFQCDTSFHTYVGRDRLDDPGIESRCGEIFRARPYRPNLLYNGHGVSFPGVKRPGSGVNYPPPSPSSAKIKERVEQYFYSTSGPSWPVTWTFIPRELLTCT